MKRVLFAILYLLPLLAIAATRDDPSVTVTGEASMRVPADRVYVLFYSREEAKSARTAMKHSVQSVESTMDAIKRKFGRKTGYEMVNTGVLQFGEDGDEYRAGHCIWVGCDPDQETVWDIIDDGSNMHMLISPSDAVKTGLPFSPIIYAVEDYKEAEDLLEEKALADARVRAEKLAERAGKKTGEVLSIQTGLISARGRELDFPTPYISNNQTGVMMRQTVTITYQLLPKDPSVDSEQP